MENIAKYTILIKFMDLIFFLKQLYPFPSFLRCATSIIAPSGTIPNPVVEPQKYLHNTLIITQGQLHQAITHNTLIITQGHLHQGITHNTLIITQGQLHQGITHNTLIITQGQLHQGITHNTLIITQGAQIHSKFKH